MHALSSPIAVVAHDAGAANLILAWLKAWDVSVRAYMEGPAAKLWFTAFPGIQLCSSLQEVLEGAATLISGTGWASRLEHEARLYARAKGIRSVAVLDHWVNYVPRFVRDGAAQWPDELWVADEWALRIAQEEIPAIPVRRFENLYLQAQVAQVQPAPRQGNVLYVLEPVRQTWGREEAGEFQALDFALKHIDKLSLGRVSQIFLRPHPSETSEKYSHYLEVDPRIRIDTSVDMAQALGIADVVMGVESFALAIALAAGRPVFSSLPPWAPALRLPHAGIQQIRHLSFL
jgi:hypothetical protein